jgi:Flp pilus assembly protein TadB
VNSYLTRGSLARQLPSTGQGGKRMHLIRDAIFLVLFFILLAAWLLAWAAFHLTAHGIHILLLIAVIMLILHFVGRRRTV